MPQPNTGWPDLLAALVSRRDLSNEQAYWAMCEIMRGRVSSAVLGGFLTALSTKGETVDELAGLARAMVDNAEKINIQGECLDIVGTGGDRLKTVNISTTAAIVIAAAGIPVVKHGNRASSSASGSADVLEALGVNLAMDIPSVEETFRQLGITFLFANMFHPSMRFAAPARRELGIGTSFNLLGPLTNPAKPRWGAIGVYSPRLAPLVAGVLAQRGGEALVFRADNGMDELTAITPNTVWEVRAGAVEPVRFDAVKELGLAPCTVEDLRGAEATYNAKVTRAVLEGQNGPVREAVALNAAAAITAHGKLLPEQTPGSPLAAGENLTARLSAAYEIAQNTIESGAAATLLEKWVATTKTA